MENVNKSLAMSSMNTAATVKTEDIDPTTTSNTGNTCTTTSAEAIDRSMVIYVQQQQPELSVPLLTAGSSNPAEQQLVTIVPQSFTDGAGDTLSSLSSPDQPQALPEEDIVASLLGSVVTNTSGDDNLLSQRTGAFRTEDGQIIFLTYTLNPALDEVSVNQQSTNEGSQRMVLHMTDDGSTIMLPAENVEAGGLDVISANESAILSQLNINGVYSLIANSSLTEEPQLDEPSEILKHRPFNEINNRRRTEQVIGNELHIEKKLEVLDAMLTPAPERSRKKKVETNLKPAEGSYMCDLCDITFPRATQFYGHLHCHSGERMWECATCPGKVMFSNQSQLRRHEKESHLNLRPHSCSKCAARFDRVSQLNYHERRIHAGERAHACQICHKAFFKRSDLKTHLNIHLGINKCICETCGKKFNHVSNLIRHTRMHSGIKPYPCTVCGRRFSQLNALHQHKTSHQTDKDVACSICRKMFKSHMVMRKHVRLLHRDKLAASGKDSGTVLKMKEGAQARRFYCKVCGENFQFAALLKQHELQHEKENNFHCSCCDQDYETVELLKSHSCQTPEERLQKEAEDEAEAERVALNSQLECLLQEHNAIVGGTEERNNTNGSGIMGEIIIYVTQEGQEEPTQVHIRPMPDTLLSNNCQQRSLMVIPNSNEVQRTATQNQQHHSNQDNTSNVQMATQSENACHMTTDLDGSLSTPLHLEFCSGTINSNENRNATVASRTQSVTSSLFNQSITANLGSDNSNDNFVAGGDVLGEPSHDSDCDNVLPTAIGNTSSREMAKMNDVLSILQHKHNSTDISLDVKDPLALPGIPVTNVATGQSNERKQVRVYQCPECPKAFLKNSNFKQHLGIHFIDQQRYRCSVCGQSFAWKSTLNKHMLTHSAGPLPRYRCDLCSKEYAAATQVQEHIKRDHYKQRPHACVVCGKTFYKKYDLKIHLRTHTKERPYICGTCGKSFYHLSHIIRHERIHSGQRPYQCPDCGRQFNQSSSLKSHSKRHKPALNQCVSTKSALNECVSIKPDLKGIELPSAELVQPELPEIEPDAVLLLTGADL